VDISFFWLPAPKRLPRKEESLFSKLFLARTPRTNTVQFLRNIFCIPPVGDSALLLIYVSERESAVVVRKGDHTEMELYKAAVI
jgi:hypothetical protein